MLNLPRLPKFWKSNPDIIQRMRMRHFLTYMGLSLVLIFFGIAIATNLFNGGRKTEAASKTFNSNDDYILDGWEMSNNNVLGRVAPKINGNLTGKDVNVTGGADVRFDHSTAGFSNSPLFASVNSDGSLTSIDTDGTTHLNNLTITGSSSVTNTPLDFLTTYQPDSRVNNGYPFFIRYTGYYYNENSIADLEIGALSDDGTRIKVWNGSAYVTLYDNYTNGAYDIDPTKLTTYYYLGGTYLPIQIDYYNAVGAAGFGLVVRTSSSPEKWYVPKAVSNSLAGRFYSGPADTYPEGLVADYYVDNSLRESSYDEESYTNHSTLAWSDSIIPPIRFYRFSFLTKKYLVNYMSSATVCAIAANQEYATLAALEVTKTDCSGYGGPFLHSDGYFVNNLDDPGVSTELYQIGTLARPDYVAVKYGDNGLSKWIGGRSRIRFDITNALSVSSSSSLNADGAGWPSGPALNNNDPVNIQCGGRCSWHPTWVFARGLGYGGGWLNYTTGSNSNNGVAGGGSFGGYGVSSEDKFDQHDYNLLPRNRYGDDRDVEYVGSGGGFSDNGGAYSGAGGGMIKIKLKNLVIDGSSRISANGQKAYSTNGAGGSGGGVHLTFNQTQTLSSNTTITADGGNNTNSFNVGSGGGGRIWIENAEGNSGNTTGIRARKGCYAYDSSGTCSILRGDYDLPYDLSIDNATDGTVIIDKEERLPLSIKKVLTPVERDGSANTNYNPYALRANDKIKVTLTVQDVVVGTLIEDEVLRQQPPVVGSYFCDPGGQEISGGGIYANSKVAWAAQETLAGESFFYYYCRVRK